MEVINPDSNKSISEFYKDKNVFITGATGFLGKVLIEKLLRSCPEIGKIYILIRAKKGKGVEERVQKLLEDMLFDTLKQSNPSQLSKLVPLQGDCSQLSLGLSEDDYLTLTSTVSIIYHSAASVRFDDSLKDAIILNTRGTREVAQLALKTSRLSVFVHISTTYCNCVHGKDIKEQFYPSPDDWKKAIKIAEQFNQEELAILSQKYLGSYPNTYTFTKALAEHVIKDLCEGKITTIIFRPSIIISTLDDPVSGWIDNFNGPMGLLTACGKGLLRSSYQEPDINSDFIPVDITVKILVTGSWDIGIRKQCEQVEIIQCSNGGMKFISIQNMLENCRNLSNQIPLNDSLWVPKGNITKCVVYAYICQIFFHLLPAIFFDICLKILGKKTILVKLQTKIYNASVQLRYFTFQEWIFSNKNMLSINEKILEKDKETWGFDISSIDFNQFIKNSMFGLRRYLLHEPDESLPQARIHYQRMYWLDKITMCILYGSLIWLIFYFGVHQAMSNRICNYFSFYFNNQ